MAKSIAIAAPGPRAFGGGSVGGSAASSSLATGSTVTAPSAGGDGSASGRPTFPNSPSAAGAIPGSVSIGPDRSVPSGGSSATVSVSMNSFAVWKRRCALRSSAFANH